MIESILEKVPDLLQVAALLVAGASFVANLTTNKRDDRAVAWLARAVDMLALNFNVQKEKSNRPISRPSGLFSLLALAVLVLGGAAPEEAHAQKVGAELKGQTLQIVGYPFPMDEGVVLLGLSAFGGSADNPCALVGFDPRQQVKLLQGTRLRGAPARPGFRLELPRRSYQPLGIEAGVSRLHAYRFDIDRRRLGSTALFESWSWLIAGACARRDQALFDAYFAGRVHEVSRAGAAAAEILDAVRAFPDPGGRLSAFDEPGADPPRQDVPAMTCRPSLLLSKASEALAFGKALSTVTHDPQDHEDLVKLLEAVHFQAERCLSAG